MISSAFLTKVNRLNLQRPSRRLSSCFFSSLLCAAVTAVFVVPSLRGQTPQEILAKPDVKLAMEAIQSSAPHFVDQQIGLCEIPAPPFHEDKRAAEMANLFREEGLENVRIDNAGNVLGDRPGDAPHPHLVIAAHLDTVFPPGTDVHVTRVGNLLKGPGIGDDCRGLASLLSIIRAMKQANLHTHGSLTFVADVGEEGLGDLRGMKELFGTTMKGQIDDFISIEPGEANRVTDGGVGSYRYKVTYSGPGGHSYGAFGIANPADALGRAIAHIADFQVPTEPKTTFNVGVIGGGTSVNAIPFEAWFEFDERSPDTASLDQIDSKFKTAVQAGLDEENARWHGKGKLSVKLDSIGVRPAGHTDSNSPIVVAAANSIKALNFGEPEFNASSSDSNVPMHLGIPAITIGGGGHDTGAHSLNETDDITDSYKGPQNALLIILTLLQ
jgi:acetylornithine deacetylase/succinyl-diaminopimelate desuccinylase-like protein